MDVFKMVIFPLFCFNSCLVQCSKVLLALTINTFKRDTVNSTCNQTKSDVGASFSRIMGMVIHWPQRLIGFFLIQFTFVHV